MTTDATSPPSAAPVGGVRRAATALHLVLAVFIAVAVLAQVYLIGGYIFGAGQGALDAHESVGWSVHTAELLLLIVALVARLPRPDLLMSLALAVLGTVQVTLASSEKWLGALHPLLALAVLGLAAHLAQRGLKRRRLTAPSP